MEITIQYFINQGVAYFGNEEDCRAEFDAKINLLSVEDFESYCQSYLHEIPDIVKSLYNI